MTINSRNDGIARCIIWILALLLLFLAVYSLQTSIDHSFKRSREEGLMYLPTGRFLKPLCLGFDSLAADLLWIKAIGYFGGHYLTDRSYTWLYHILDLVTTLDPHFRYPYEFGGIILALEGGNPDQSTALMEKGLLSYPDYWRLHFYVGFNYLYYHRDPEKASFHIVKAAQLPGHPQYLPRLAASLLVTSGKKEGAMSFLQQLYDNTEDAWLRVQIKRKIDDLRAGRLSETLKGLFEE
ncbi:MAG: tetratricopeptide repeat protein [bacterium]